MIPDNRLQILLNTLVLKNNCSCHSLNKELQKICFCTIGIQNQTKYNCVPVKVKNEGKGSGKSRKVPTLQELLGLLGKEPQMSNGACLITIKCSM
jgi:hypothetical protein